MKSFKDIEFKPHSFGEGLHGLIFFDNGYGLSVVRFKSPLSKQYLFVDRTNLRGDGA